MVSHHRLVITEHTGCCLFTETTTAERSRCVKNESSTDIFRMCK